jgi:hypothetical protein
LILENTVLFDEMIDDCLLLAVKPAGQAGYQEMERLYGICHCWRLSQPAKPVTRRWKGCMAFVIARTDYPQY